MVSTPARISMNSSDICTAKKYGHSRALYFFLFSNVSSSSSTRLIYYFSLFFLDAVNRSYWLKIINARSRIFCDNQLLFKFCFILITTWYSSTTDIVSGSTIWAPWRGTRSKPNFLQHTKYHITEQNKKIIKRLSKIFLMVIIFLTWNSEYQFNRDVCVCNFWFLEKQIIWFSN